MGDIMEGMMVLVLGREAACPESRLRGELSLQGVRDPRVPQGDQRLEEEEGDKQYPQLYVSSHWGEVNPNRMEPHLKPK